MEAVDETIVDTTKDSDELTKIDVLTEQLLKHFGDKMVVQPELTRQLVSFQANKTKAAYRWFKYKEAFSVDLVGYLFDKYKIVKGKVLDPFAGMGTTLFAASSRGIDADGIELLPIGQQIIAARKCLESDFTANDFIRLREWESSNLWLSAKKTVTLPTINISKGAYPQNTVNSIELYLSELINENANVQLVLRFALLCVLESVSYTRKDGQYLRWDHRSGLRTKVKNPFHKGPILEFDSAVSEKLCDILNDLHQRGYDQAGQLKLNNVTDHIVRNKKKGTIDLHHGSCLDQMPKLKAKTYDAIMTSPPYCNRYDYTRTYALELALLGVDNSELSALRQQMLSCTVENRAKEILSTNAGWNDAVVASDNQVLLQAILEYLERLKTEKKLNNNGIPRMIRGYFYEMACIIAESSRVLKRGGYMIMVNDNVRYAGASISVDLILSSIAESLGFSVEEILVLPGKKGNSSQQMGEHGRDALRKCIYVWRKV